MKRFLTFVVVMLVAGSVLAEDGSDDLAYQLYIKETPDKVRVTDNPDVVEECEYLGEAKGKGAWGGMFMQRIGENKAYKHLQEAVYKRGGNTALLTSTQTGFSGAKYRAEAYYCEDAMPTYEQWKKRINRRRINE